LLEIYRDPVLMLRNSLCPAGSASPPAGHCRGAPLTGAPALPADFDAGAGEGEARLTPRRIDRSWMFIGPYVVPAPPRLLVRGIQAAVEAHFGLAPGTLRSPRRDREAARPRQLAMYLARRLAGRSLTEIGRLFGDRHHTSVLHAIRAIEALRLADRGMEHHLRFLVHALTCPEQLR
jgi:chromosomal replication initiator protein